MRRIMLLLLGLALALPARAAQQIVNNGAAPGDGTAESIYGAFGKVNHNFTELYDGTGLAGVTLSGITLSGTTALPGSGQISSAGSLGLGVAPAAKLNTASAAGNYGDALFQTIDAGAAAVNSGSVQGWAIRTNGASPASSTYGFLAVSGSASQGMMAIDAGVVTAGSGSPAALYLNPSGGIVTSSFAGFGTGGYKGGAFANGQAQFFSSPSLGAILEGLGTLDDVVLQSAAGNALIVPHGSLSVDVAGGLQVGGGAFGGVAGTGLLSASASSGASLTGNGSTYDAAIADSGGSVALGVLHGTTTVAFAGAVQMAALAGGAPSKYVCADAGNNLVLSATAC